MNLCSVYIIWFIIFSLEKQNVLWLIPFRNPSVFQRKIFLGPFLKQTRTLEVNWVAECQKYIVTKLYLYHCYSKESVKWQYLLCKHKILSSSPSPTKKKDKINILDILCWVSKLIKQGKSSFSGMEWELP
jgi:hypothetical protein